MQPIDLLSTLIRKDDSIVITLRGTEGGTQVLLQPTLKGASETETDESKRLLAVALTMPYVFTVKPGESITEALSKTLDQIAGARATTLNSYEAYQQVQAQATTQAAKVAKAAATKKSAPNAGASKAAAPTAVEPATSADDAETTAQPVVAAEATTAPELTVPAVAIDLFND